MKLARWIERGVLAALLFAGLLCPQGPRAFYASLALAFVGIAGTLLVGAAIVTAIAERSPSRLQGPRRLPRFAGRAAKDTTLAALVAASLLAWPLARLSAEEPTGLVWDVESAGGRTAVILGNLVALVALDAWLYWKHRLLHTRALFPFHRAHHGYRDPTAYASFAVGTVESVLTFWPIVLLAFPWATHYAPVYFALVGGFVLLNFYLHCGATLRLVEAILPRLGVNTSAFHNRHHANANVNFGEAMIVWDRLMGTNEAAVEARRAGAVTSR